MAHEGSTHDLIQRARAGDRAAFDALVLGVREPLERFVATRLGPALAARVEAADIVQEACLKAFRSLASYEWQGEGSFLRWITGIAHHLILQLAKRPLARERTGLQLDPAAASASPSTTLRRGERFTRLEDALKSLSPEHREVIVLTRIEGLAVDEVARRMGRTPKAARQLLWRALQSLKQSFGETDSLSLPDRRLDLEGER